MIGYCFDSFSAMGLAKITAFQYALTLLPACLLLAAFIGCYLPDKKTPQSAPPTSFKENNVSVLS